MIPYPTSVEEWRAYAELASFYLFLEALSTVLADPLLGIGFLFLSLVFGITESGAFRA
jgi:hypothetical protein